LSAAPELTGFVLSRQQRDTREGIELSYWLSTDTGAQEVRIGGQKAVFFVRRSQTDRVELLLQDLSGWTLTELELQDLTGEAVSALYSQSLKLQRSLIERLTQGGVALLEEDIRPVDRFLMERFIQGGVSVVSRSDGTPLLRPADYSTQLRMLSIDLETTLNADRIHSIGLYGEGFRRVLMRGQGEDSDWLEYLPDECALLQRLMELVRELDPDIFIGWNVIDFDFRVLSQRARALGVKLCLGRDSSVLKLITVSVKRTSRPLGRARLRVVGSRVAKSLSSAITVDPVSAFRSVLLPAFV
jgi:DNA polymerase-2